MEKFSKHVDFINDTYEGLKNPLSVAKCLVGDKKLEYNQLFEQIETCQDWYDFLNNPNYDSIDFW